MNIIKVSMFLLIFSLYTYANSVIHIIPPQSKFDSSHNYFYTLLEKILENTKKKYGHTYVLFSMKMEQGRAFADLKSRENIDIHWAGTSMQREKEFIPIRIPLLKGLLGYRVLIIKKDKLKLFESINTFDDFKKLKACQGTHWPDTKILEDAGINVVKNTNYELMFLQVQNDRCDYFPRGIHEAFSEIESRKEKYPNLMIFDKLIIYYPFPMYFFVSNENKILAKRVEKGLLNIINDGSFDNYIKQHEVTRHLFPINNWINTKTFKLDNLNISKDTDLKNDKFWIFLK